MKNFKKQSHPLRLFACALTAAILALAAVSPEACRAEVTKQGDVQAYAFDASISGISGSSLGKCSEMDSKKAEYTGKGTIDKTELSLEDAVAIAQKEAARYYSNLHLTDVYSYDNDRIPQISSGADGRRQWWYVNFANEEENFVSILIADGEILSTVHFDKNANHGFFDLSDVKLSAKQAALKARALGLRGGNPRNQNEWVSGLNFKLSYASLADSPDDIRLFFEVIGISPAGNFAHVDFDAVTGELLLAEEKIEYANGDVEWRKF